MFVKKCCCSGSEVETTKHGLKFYGLIIDYLALNVIIFVNDS